MTLEELKDSDFVVGMKETERTGCQLSGMMTAYLVANPDEPLKAAAAAVLRKR